MLIVSRILQRRCCECGAELVSDDDAPRPCCAPCRKKHVIPRRQSREEQIVANAEELARLELHTWEWEATLASLVYLGLYLGAILSLAAILFHLMGAGFEASGLYCALGLLLAVACCFTAEIARTLLWIDYRA
jgi:hypothetical protein